MPSVSGWALRRTVGRTNKWSCFYALGIGLGIATPVSTVFRDLTRCFYALGIGLGIATHPHHEGGPVR